MSGKKSKYGSRKVTVDGVTYDSVKEYRRFKELSLLEKAGTISELERQRRYKLVPAQYESYPRYGKRGQRLKDGKRCVEQAVFYVADFAYIDENGNHVVEDTKGFKTKDYIIKRKLMLWVHGIHIREV